jgi:hypothetical protein
VRRRDDLNREDILSKILQWSELAGLTVREIEDPSADFHLVVSEPKLPSIDIVHPQAESQFVLFAARVLPPEEIQTKMLDLDTKQRNELLWNIRLKLLSTSLEFRIVGAESGIPSAYEIYSKLFLEGATVQNFWQTYVNMKNALMLIISLHRKFLGLP